jgi:hypothetical protein
MDNWSPDGTWSGLKAPTPHRLLSKLTCLYTETTPHNAGTVATSRVGHLDVEQQQATRTRSWCGSTISAAAQAAPQVRQATINGQQWTLYQNGSGG